MIVSTSTNVLAGTEQLLQSAAIILLDAQCVARDGGESRLETQVHALVIAVLDLVKEVKQQRMASKMALSA